MLLSSILFQPYVTAKGVAKFIGVTAVKTTAAVLCPPLAVGMDFTESAYDFYTGDYIGGTINAVSGVVGIFTLGLFSSAKQTAQGAAKGAMVKTVRESTKEMTKETKKKVGKQFGKFLAGEAATKAMAHNALLDVQKVAMKDIAKTTGAGLAVGGTKGAMSGVKAALQGGPKSAAKNGSEAAMKKTVQTIAKKTGIHTTKEVGRHFAADAGRVAAKKVMEKTAKQVFAVELGGSALQGIVYSYDYSQRNRETT